MDQKARRLVGNDDGGVDEEQIDRTRGSQASHVGEDVSAHVANSRC
jgi:hypothetical protein